TATFHCKVMIETVRTRKGWNYPSCGGGQCKKGATRQLGKWFCEACNKSIDYPVLRYRLELGVADDTAHVVVVLFDEPATELLKCSAESLMASVDEVSLYLLFNYFHRFQTNLYLQSADEDSNLPVAITNLIGTTHIFELKSHTYYEYGTFESFTCWKINPAGMMEEVASSTTVDENTDNHSPEFKSLAQTPSLSTPSKGPEEKKKKRSEVEESDADDDCGSSKQPPECNADAGTENVRS
ncbi:DNA helicase PIF1, ATP-dependent, partial [Tanacetum coccineum]